MVTTDDPEIDQPEVEDQGEKVNNEGEETLDVPKNSALDKEYLTKLVKRERARGIEKGRREALMELQQQQQQQQADSQQQQQIGGVNPAEQAQQQPNQQPASVGGMPQLSREDIAKMIAEQAPKALQQHAQAYQHQQLVNSFVGKMTAAETKYPGLESKLNELDYNDAATVALVRYADQMENTGDIMNELLENPMKMGNLMTLLEKQPKLAAKAIQNLSSSIKMNTDASAQEKSSNEPFSQIKPSNNASKDDGNMSVTDYRAMFRKKK